MGGCNGGGGPVDGSSIGGTFCADGTGYVTCLSLSTWMLIILRVAKIEEKIDI